MSLHKQPPHSVDVSNTTIRSTNMEPTIKDADSELDFSCRYRRFEFLKDITCNAAETVFNLMENQIEEKPDKKLAGEAADPLRVWQRST